MSKMIREIQETQIAEISGLPFKANGKMPKLGGRKSLPLFSIAWSDVEPKPKPDYSNCASAGEARQLVADLNAKWKNGAFTSIDAAVGKLVAAGFVVKDPVLMTDVYEYSAFFIYEEKK